MRQAIGGTWVFSIVITFMMILIAYVCIQMNYSRAYMLKTDMITIIEQYDGFNDKAITEISKKISSEGYTQSGSCSSLDQSSGNGGKIYGVNDGVPLDFSRYPGKYQYCITRLSQAGGDNTSDKYYYTVVVFFGFTLPVLGNIYNFTVNGQTNVIYYPHDNYF